MQIVLNYKNLSQVIDVSEDLKVSELFSLACLTFLDTDSPDDKSLVLFYDSKILDDSQTLDGNKLSNGAEIHLRSKNSVAPKAKTQNCLNGFLGLPLAILNVFYIRMKSMPF